MEVLTDPEDDTLSRSSTTVTFNTSYQGNSNVVRNGRQTRTNSVRCSNEPAEMEVLTQPEDGTFSRSSTTVTFNTSYQGNSNVVRNGRQTRTGNATVRIEVLTEPEDRRLNRQSTQVTFCTEFEKGELVDEELSDKSSNTWHVYDSLDDTISVDNSDYEDDFDTRPPYSFFDDSVYEDDFDTSSAFEDEDKIVGSCTEKQSTQTTIYTEFEKGELVEETLSDKSSNKCSESEAKPSSDESVSKKCRRIMEDLGNGIYVKYPGKYKIFWKYTTRPLDNLTRSIQLHNLGYALDQSRIITKMYGIYLKSAKKQPDKLAILPFTDDCSEDVELFVNVGENISPNLEYIAHIRKKNGWKKVPVQLMDRFCQFQGGAFDMLFLASRPIDRSFLLTPKGGVFSSRYDKQIQGDCPRGCVQRDKKLVIQKDTGSRQPLHQTFLDADTVLHGTRLRTDKTEIQRSVRQQGTARRIPQLEPDKTGIQRSLRQQGTGRRIPQSEPDKTGIQRSVRQQGTGRRIPQSEPEKKPNMTSEGIILELTNKLEPNNWKFTFRKICVVSGIEADNIISEAVKNNPNDVREALYQSLKKWAAMKHFINPRDMLDRVIEGLKRDEKENLIGYLKQKFFDFV